MYSLFLSSLSSGFWHNSLGQLVVPQFIANRQLLCLPKVICIPQVPAPILLSLARFKRFTLSTLSLLLRMFNKVFNVSSKPCFVDQSRPSESVEFGVGHIMNTLQTRRLPKYVLCQTHHRLCFRRTSVFIAVSVGAFTVA